ncbi:hypothetical protein ABPG74_014300 [Tetrahymena malaccensis]
MSEEQRKVAQKWFKVFRTICEMARDRGYSEEAEQQLNLIKTKEQENMWIQNNISNVQNSLTLNSFSHDSNQADDHKFLGMEQHLYFFHSQTKLTDDILSQYDKTIQKYHESSIRNNPSLNVFINVVILVPEEKDIVTKKVQDIILISNKYFKDRIELFEKKQVEMHFNSKKQTEIKSEADDKGDVIQIFYKYEIFFFDDLVINITKHQLVPKHVPLSAIEKKKLMEKYKINDAQLPKILSTDPITKYFGLRTKQVFKIERDSETAGKYITYRIVS